MKTKKEIKYHYFYKITNTINNHFYYGIHSTDNLDDGYMGSGSRLNYAYKKYGIENFTKEILKFFDSRKECSDYEAEVVNEVLIEDPNCYNVILGGDTWNCVGTVSVKDSNGNYFRTNINDERILSGELKGINAGNAVYKDKTGKHIYLPINDPKVLSGEVVSIMKNVGMYKDKNGNILQLSVDDPRVLSKDVISMSKGKILVKDKYNTFYLIDKTDEMYLSGELKPFWSGRKHNDETKEKIRQAHMVNEYQKGEKNSQYGTCWITKDNENKKVKKEYLDEYISLGWKAGRVIKNKNTGL